jgi:predicted enzyme related to lactoylglutathione lyase
MLAIADVAVTVTNAKATAEWWEKTMGFATHTVGSPGGHGVTVAPPGERFLLHLCEGLEPVEPGNTGIAFMTDDIEGVVRGMERKGVHFPEALKKFDWGGMAKFADPDGNVFWLLGASRQFIRQEITRRAGSRKPSRTTPRPRRRGASRTG